MQIAGRSCNLQQSGLAESCLVMNVCIYIINCVSILSDGLVLFAISSASSEQHRGGIKFSGWSTIYALDAI